jgi:lysyl-tRNA synthetase class 2
VHDAVSQAVDTILTPGLASALTPGTPLDEVRAVCRRAEVAWRDHEPVGVLVARLYDRFVPPATDTPVFYVDFPVETSLSARAHRTDPRLAERWDLVAFGTTVGTACSGLADPVEQRRRLASTVDGPALDEDLLTALELGMPPTGSLGLGIDQMVTMLLGTTVRDVLAFPFVR